MQPIDRRFRFTWDFCIVWAFLTAVVFLLTRRSELAEVRLSYFAILILLPFFGTFVLYGPVLLARQIIHSGSRGWFVARVLFSVLLAAVVFAAVLFYTGHADDASWWGGTASFVAIVYLHWRLTGRSGEPHA
jgi:hypothetical protein